MIKPDPANNLWLITFKNLKKNRLAIIGLIIISTLIISAVLVPFLVNSVPLYLKKHVHNEDFAEALVPGKAYFPLFFNYPEFDFSSMGKKSAGHGFERWIKRSKKGKRKLKTFYRDARITMLFPPFQFAPTSINLSKKLQQPSFTNLMGTDDLGRDVFTRVLYGARTSLAVGLIAQLFALLIGVPLGMIAGFYSNQKGPKMGLLLALIICFMFTAPLTIITGLKIALKWGIFFGSLTFLITSGPFLFSFSLNYPGLSLLLLSWPLVSYIFYVKSGSEMGILTFQVLALIFWCYFSYLIHGYEIPKNPNPEKLKLYCLSVDDFIMWMINVVSAFPFLLLVIAIVATVETPDIKIVFVAIGIVGWVEIARLVRGQVLSLKEKEFIEAIRSVGANDLRILLFHVLPNVLAPIIVSVTLGIASAIMIEAGLSFLGLGVQPPEPTWGGMINDGRAYLEESPWMVIFPGISIMLTVFSFNLLGDGLRDALDPKTQK
ncbi:ABC transporter permease [Candidatus Riflebacteria bacterium]